MTHSSRNAQATISRVQSDEPGGTDVSGSIRSRNRRLAPGTPQELLGRSSGSGTATDSPLGSRTASPASRLSRPAADDIETKSGIVRGSSTADLSRPGKSRGEPGFGDGLLDGGWGAGWNRIQGLAHSVLGVDLTGSSLGHVSNKNEGSKAANSNTAFTKSPGFWPSAGTWGAPEPPVRKDDMIATGSTEDREVAVRAKKMARVLEGRDVLESTLDSNGHVKRRTSTEETRSVYHEEDDALVYIHQVQPRDTLAGVILRYNCHPTVFRKANRFWPNDSIQTRKMVVLPVDACSVKGRPCSPPSTVDPASSPVHTTPETWPSEASPFDAESEVQLGMGISTECPEAEEKPWVHVRWVLLDTVPTSKPVEIAKMPRQTLGYFPPRRRKSQSTISAGDTPRASLDWSRSPRLLSQSLDSPDVQRAVSPRMSFSGSAPAHSRRGSFAHGAEGRRESVSQAAERLGWMTGPGGVGTLGRNIRKPGPARDALNKWANKHVPGIAIDSLPSASISDSEGVSFGFKSELAKIAEGRYDSMVSGTVTPNGGNQGMALENAAAAVEGWFRKLAASAPGTPRMSGVRRVESSDLIELLDGTGSDDGRGFELAPGTIRSSPVGTTGREDLEGIIRGRDKAGTKGRKSD